MKSASSAPHFVKRLSCLATIALGVALADEASAQNAQVLQDTPTWAIAREASLLNAQVFGAVRAFDRLVGQRPAPPGALSFGAQANWVWGGTSAPALSKDGRWVKQDIDLYANNIAFQLCAPGAIRACAFYSSALTVTFTPDNTQSRVAGSLISFTGPLVYGHAVAPLSVAGIAEGKSGINAIQSSVLGGGTLTFGDYFTARAGFIGSVDRRGVYANATAPRVKAFLSAALTEGLLSTLMGGIENFDIRDLAGTEQQPQQKPVERKPSAFPSLTAYVRQLKLFAPQLNPAVAFAGETLLGQFDFRTIHAGLGHLGKYVDVSVAYAVAPKPVLHEAQGSINLIPDTEGILRFGGGVTQLPDLPFYGVSGGLRPSMIVEIGQTTATYEMKYSVRLNDAETLTYFPFAQNSFSMFFVFNGYVPVFGD